MTVTNTSVKDTGPWYKQPWPWILMSGPMMVIVASFISAWVALSSADGLVVEDYYKKGLAANQTIAMSDKAKSLGLEAGITLSENSISTVLSSKDKTYQMPPQINVTLAHPTRAGMDQVLRLDRGADGYKGNYRLPRAGHWIITVEDEAGSWRLMGNVMLPASGVTVIGGLVSTDVRNQQ
ncbi:MAG TPA: FixH family protein [Rhodocyclaceae bacterium]